MNFIKRTVVAAIFVPIVIFCIISDRALLGSELGPVFSFRWFDLMVAIILILALHELVRMLKQIEPTVSQAIFYSSGISLFFAAQVLNNCWLLTEFIPKLLLLCTIAVVIALTAFFGVLLLAIVRKNIKRSFTAAALTLAGFFYIPFSCAAYIIIRPLDFAAGHIVAVIVISWMTDIGAYCIGTPLGRHRLVPHVSPKKSVEGALGGVVAAMLTALALRAGGIIGGSIVTALGLGLILAVTGQFGDLVESIIKREADVKDSGALLPGHGGILDALDSTFFNVFPVLIYLLLTGGSFR